MYISRFVGVLAVLLAVAAGPHGQPLIAGAAAPGTGGIAVSTTAHGLKVTIAIPRRVYPRDALVRASLGFQNLSSHTVYYEPGNGMDMLFVANGRGRKVYSPALRLGSSTLVVPKGPRRILSLRPGQTVIDRVYLVLRGRYIEATVAAGRSFTGRRTVLSGPRVSLRLTTGAAPQVTVTDQPSLTATVAAPWPVSGPMVYDYETRCTTQAWSGGTGKGWVTSRETTLKPIFQTGDSPVPVSTCPGAVEWNGLVGWLNHPVANFSYRTLPNQP